MSIRFHPLPALALAGALLCLSIPVCGASPLPARAASPSPFAIGEFDLSPLHHWDHLYQLSQIPRLDPAPVPSNGKPPTSAWSLADVYGSDISLNEPDAWTSAPPTTEDTGVLRIDPIFTGDDETSSTVSAQSVLWADSALWADSSQ